MEYDGIGIWVISPDMEIVFMDPVISDFRSYAFSGVISKPYMIEEILKVFAAILV